MTTCRNCNKGLNPDDSSCQECGQVVFADQKLENVVRKTLEKPEGPLTRGVIRELTKLRAYKIKDLQGIDSAVNPTDLDLEANRLSQKSIDVHVPNFKARGVRVATSSYPSRRSQTVSRAGHGT